MITTRRNLSGWLASCALTATIVVMPAWASDTPAGKTAAPKTTPVVEPMADRVLRAATDLLKNARGFTVETNVAYDELLGNGIMVQYSRHGTVTVRRPDRIYAEVTDDLSERRLWFDGKTATVYKPARNLYAQAKVPGSIDEFVDTLHNEYGITLSNTETVPGKTITAFYGVVSGNTVRAKHLGRDFMAGLKNLVGGELRGYTELLQESREEAVRRMIAQAHSMGANAVVNVRFATRSVAQGAAELFAYGTAVKVE